MYYVKFNVFGLIGHICPLKMISLSLSILSRDNFNATYLTYYDVIQRVQAQAIAVVHYACFSLNKFESQVSILWYNALCLITSYYAFNISSTKPNACMIFSQLQCALLIVTFINKFMNTESHYSIPHILCEDISLSVPWIIFDIWRW